MLCLGPSGQGDGSLTGVATSLLNMLSPTSAGGGLGGLPAPGRVEELALPLLSADGGAGTPADGRTGLPKDVGGQSGSSAYRPKSVGMESGENDEEETPFVLNEGLPAVPAKLVRKIQKGSYVDMEELLRDNMELCRRGEDDKSNSKSNRRSVPDILSWVACFGLYASIVAEKYPHGVKELWAYQTLLVQLGTLTSGTKASGTSEKDSAKE